MAFVYENRSEGKDNSNFMNVLHECPVGIDMIKKFLKKPYMMHS
jgi:hypothetical protein